MRGGNNRTLVATTAALFAQRIGAAAITKNQQPQSSPLLSSLLRGGVRALSSAVVGGGVGRQQYARPARYVRARVRVCSRASRHAPRSPCETMPKKRPRLVRTFDARADATRPVPRQKPFCCFFSPCTHNLHTNRCGATSSSSSAGYEHEQQRHDGGMTFGGGFAVRGMAKKVKIPKSGGVEGFDDAFLRSIKKRRNPIDPFDGTFHHPGGGGGSGHKKTPHNPNTRIHMEKIHVHNAQCTMRLPPLSPTPTPW